MSRVLKNASFLEIPEKATIKLHTPSQNVLTDPLTIFLYLAQVSFQRPVTPQETTWLEWTYSQLCPQELENPHHTSSAVFEFMQGRLARETFLSGEERPGPADLLLAAVLAGRMRAMTCIFMNKYFRIVRWFNSVNSIFHLLPNNIDITPHAIADTSIINKKELSKKEKGKETEKGKEKVVTIASNAFYRAEVRVGRIVSVEKHPNADRLFVEKVDIGREEPITVVSGLVGHVTLEELQNRLALFVVNLKPAVMFKVKSQGMILVSKNSNNSADMLEPVKVPEGAKPGERLLLEGFGEEQADVQLNPKEAPWTEVISALECRDGTVYYQKDKRVLVNGQPITSAKVPNGIIS